MPRDLFRQWEHHRIVDVIDVYCQAGRVADDVFGNEMAVVAQDALHQADDRLAGEHLLERRVGLEQPDGDPFAVFEPMLKWLLVIAGLIVVVVVALGSTVVYKIGPRNIIGMLRYDQRREGDLEEGKPAPDIALVGLDGTSEVRLEDRIGGTTSGDRNVIAGGAS